MIKDLDLSLKTLLLEEAEPGSELASANISFSVPDEKWQGSGSGIDLNVYLYDIRENRNLRTNERQYERNPDGSTTQKKSPPRIDCAYLITAWNKATGTSEEKELQEHRLLSQVLYVLMRNPTIASEPPLPLVVSQQDGLPNPVEFWSALGSPLKPSISCVVTLSLDLKKWITGPMVITKITEYEQLGKPGTRDEVIQIGGRITNTADPPVGIGGAEVTILELQKKTTTDSNGYYTFANLPRGRFTFEALASGYQNEQVTLDIPAPSEQNYDIQLSK